MEKPTLEASREAWREWMTEQAQDILAATVGGGYSMEERDGRDYLVDRAIEWDLANSSRGNDIFVRRYFWSEIKRFARIADSEWDSIAERVGAILEERRRNKHDFALRVGLQSASESIEWGNAEAMAQARKALEQALSKADEALAEKPAEPIISVADGIALLRQDLLSTQGRTHLGLCQKSLPLLDDATGGFRGLMLVAAKPGVGKTTLLLQNMLDILENYADTCAVFFSLDMTRDVIMRRMASYLANLSLLALRCGTGDGGWTKEEGLAVDRALAKLSILGRRIKVLDRFNFPHVSRASMMQVIARTMDETKTERCFNVMDFLELLPAPDKYKTEYDQAAWQIEEVRTIADMLKDSPLVCIAEQGHNIEGPAVKGNSRKSGRADMILSLTEFSSEDLLALYDINNGYATLRAKRQAYKEKDAVERAKEIRQSLAERGEAPIMLKVGKARDGAMRTEFNVINHFQKNMFTQMAKV